MIQITRADLRGLECDDEIAELRGEFDRVHCIRIRRFLAPALLETIQAGVARGRFAERAHPGIGVEECMMKNGTHTALHLLMNDERVLELVRRITGARAVAGFDGRVYRMQPGPAHFDSWHSDFTRTRTIGTSVNLSAGEFRGGQFQLRLLGSETLLTEVANTGPGDAIFFRIGEDLSHRVAGVEGDTAKTAFAGWFEQKSKFASRLLAPALRAASGD